LRYPKCLTDRLGVRFDKLFINRSAATFSGLRRGLPAGMLAAGAGGATGAGAGLGTGGANRRGRVAIR
jgi:hypothetical protein